MKNKRRIILSLLLLMIFSATSAVFFALADVGDGDKQDYALVLEEYEIADYEKGVEIGKEIGLKVFLGVESSYKGTDFLIYGLDKAWYLAHPEIMELKRSALLSLLRENGALVIQAHPFRQAGYIDHVRLFPDRVDGFEVINGNRTDTENKMALIYADEYHLLKTAGSDNHDGAAQIRLAGMAFDTPLENEADYIRRVKAGEGRIFSDISTRS